MGFIELQPRGKAAGTGVRLTLSERFGLLVSVKGRPVLALGGPAACEGPCSVAVDPVGLLLRVRPHAEGRFRFSKPPRFLVEDPAFMLRIGQVHELPDVEIRGADCTWEPLEEGPGIDIDLPRELRRVEKAGAKGVSVPRIPSLQRGGA